MAEIAKGINLPKLKKVKSTPVINSKKKTILLLSDDCRMTSGVGVMSLELIRQTCKEYNWIQCGGAIKHPEEGKKFDCSDDLREKTGVDDASLIVYPVSGYGNDEMIRTMMSMHKIDAIMIYTDPRFWKWLFDMSHELRSILPIFYYNIWDDLPYPMWNEPFYESVDLLMNITKQTWNIVRNVRQNVPVEDWQNTLVPHGINEEIFFPINKKHELYPKLLEYKDKTIRNKNTKFVMLWNNRNIRRKLPGDVVLSWKHFLDKLPAEERKNCLMIMKTPPVDNNGTDLIEVLKWNCPNAEVLFIPERLAEEDMNMLYNMVDITINIASNEGFGLGTAESLMAGTPIIVNVTGGLQDQCGFKKDGKLLMKEDYTKEWGSNHDGRYTEHGEWVKTIWPTSNSLQGSPQTPYIFDDRPDWRDAGDKIYEWYKTSNEDREKAGQAGRDYCLLPETALSAKNMGKAFVESMNTAFDKWKPVKQFKVYEV